MDLNDELEDAMNIRNLIKRQRKLSQSTQAIGRLRGAAVGGILFERLKGLSDRQIGQLLFDFCWPEPYVDSPELIIR